MRYGIVSDIHANFEALQAVLKALDAAGMERLLCLGDIVGYGPNPNECCDELRRRECLAIAGNHDEAAISPERPDTFNPLAREAIEWTKHELSAANRVYLEGLPRERELDNFSMVHGAPVFHFDYIQSVSDAQTAFPHASLPLTFIGHTHIAEVFFQDQGGRAYHLKLGHGGTIDIIDECRYIINPGSVGQPRDHNPQASFALYDPARRIVEIHRVEYDVAGVQRRMHQAKLPPQLAERLSIGY
ncbi:MAG: metallophosphatase family protein [Candidatus Eremiobacteraeota bacterium]|nr:metallophosphatase family protein [Candidatus Eremiobacteraeota bacterium]